MRYNSGDVPVADVQPIQNTRTIRKWRLVHAAPRSYLAPIKEHFRKCGVFYVAGIIVCMLLTNLLYTTTRPQVAAEREVLLYLVDALSNTEPLEPLAADALAYGQTVDETLEDVHFESILYNDPELDYTSSYLLATRMAAGDGDIYFASEIAADYMMRSEAFLPLDGISRCRLDGGLGSGTGHLHQRGDRRNVDRSAAAGYGQRARGDRQLPQSGRLPDRRRELHQCRHVARGGAVRRRAPLEGYDAPAESAEPTA